MIDAVPMVYFVVKIPEWQIQDSLPKRRQCLVDINAMASYDTFGSARDVQPINISLKPEKFVGRRVVDRLRVRLMFFGRRPRHSAIEFEVDGHAIPARLPGTLIFRFASSF